MSFAGLSIVLSTHAAQFEAVAFKGDLEANLAKIAAWGYDGVELAIRDPDMVDAQQLQAALHRSGLSVPAIGTGQAWAEEKLSFTSPDEAIRREAVRRIKNHLELACQLNAMVIIGLIRGITPASQTKDRSMRLLVECLQECAQAAAAAHVSLAFEPLNRYETDLVHSVAEGLDLIHQVGSSNLGLLLDTFHMNIEEADIYQGMSTAGKNILHFHVADSNRWHPGAGHLDFASILRSLKSTGYSGWVSGEFVPLPDADTAAEQGLAHLRRCLE